MHPVAAIPHLILTISTHTGIIVAATPALVERIRRPLVGRFWHEAFPQIPKDQGQALLGAVRRTGGMEYHGPVTIDSEATGYRFRIVELPDIGECVDAEIIPGILGAAHTTDSEQAILQELEDDVARASARARARIATATSSERLDQRPA